MSQAYSPTSRFTRPSFGNSGITNTPSITYTHGIATASASLFPQLIQNIVPFIHSQILDGQFRLDRPADVIALAGLIATTLNMLPKNHRSVFNMDCDPELNKLQRSLLFSLVNHKDQTVCQMMVAATLVLFQLSKESEVFQREFVRGVLSLNQSDSIPNLPAELKKLTSLAKGLKTAIFYSEHRQYSKIKDPLIVYY